MRLVVVVAAVVDVVVFVVVVFVFVVVVVVVVVVAVVFTLNRPLYPASSVHLVSVPIHYPRQIDTDSVIADWKAEEDASKCCVGQSDNLNISFSDLSIIYIVIGPQHFLL